jgi:hypothetical protein
MGKSTEPNDAELAAYLEEDADLLKRHGHDRVAERVHLAAQRLEAKGGIIDAANEVLSASDEFREGMGPEWEGDPLTDACDRLRAAISTTE